MSIEQDSLNYFKLIDCTSFSSFNSIFNKEINDSCRVFGLIENTCFTGLGQLGQGGMAMGGFGQSLGQLGQQSTGSLGSSLGLGNSGLPISSPSQTVYQASYGLNSLGKIIT